MQDDLYAIFMLIVVGVVGYIVYKYRVKTISIKRFFLAVFFGILFLVVTSAFSITLCYSNPTNQLILFSLLIFFVIATVQPKKIIYNASMWIFIVFVALSIHFRSFVTNGSYTTSLYYVKDMNKMRRSRGETTELSVISLWHTSFTGIYSVVKKEQR